MEELGEGGFAKVFKAKFHGQLVAMKYIPLDKVKENYQYTPISYGCHEYCEQEKVCSSDVQVMLVWNLWWASQKLAASEKFDFVDKPLAYFFAQKVGHQKKRHKLFYSFLGGPVRHVYRASTAQRKPQNYDAKRVGEQWCQNQCFEYVESVI